jgi:group I intron endonuclease
MGASGTNQPICARIYSKKSGIYKIVCNVNGKAYIGAARVLNKRIKAHIRMLKENVHENNDLQKDWNNYGESLFDVSEIAHCGVDELCRMELFYIGQHDSIANGYNKVNRGYSEGVGAIRAGKENPMYGKNHSDKSKKMISDFRKNHTGWNRSCETKQKQSDSAKRRWSRAVKKPFRARVVIGGLDVSIGYFATKEEKDEAIRLFKENYNSDTSSINR